MLAIEPAEHQRGAQDDLLDAGVENKFLLRLFRLGVIVDRHGIDDRGRDVDDVGDVVANGNFEHALGGSDVVAHKLSGVDSADLRVTVHQMRAADKLLLPGAGLCQVGVNDAQVGVETAKSLRVGRVFVDSDEFAEIPVLKPRNEVLSDQACRTCDDNLSRGHQSPEGWRFS